MDRETQELIAEYNKALRALKKVLTELHENMKFNADMLEKITETAGQLITEDHD